jgi:cobalt-precorrin-5B (C1)-methyltransferase
MPLTDLPPEDDAPKPEGMLRRGWTTGACAAAAATAAFLAMRGEPPDGAVVIVLPNGLEVSFALAELAPGLASVIKDAGDDPDVTHGALVRVALEPLAAGTGIVFLAGDGVGTVTKPGLPLPPGEPAINPGPRGMIQANLAAANGGAVPDVAVTISIPGGEEIAKRTLNGRLGIVGGLSILGTTGIVVPYSCAAWIHSIHRGIDVARAAGLTHVAGATGAVSEAAVQKLYDLPETALIDMGDFAGGMLKYLRRFPVQRVTIAGGPAKIAKLAQGMLDLHSRAGALDLAFLARAALEAGADDQTAAAMGQANSGLHAFEIAMASGVDLSRIVAEKARQVAMEAIGAALVAVDVAIFSRSGALMARAG